MADLSTWRLPGVRLHGFEIEPLWNHHVVFHSKTGQGRAAFHLSDVHVRAVARYDLVMIRRDRGPGMTVLAPVLQVMHVVKHITGVFVGYLKSAIGVDFHFQMLVFHRVDGRNERLHRLRHDIFFVFDGVGSISKWRNIQGFKVNPHPFGMELQGHIA
ncbi:MAG: hypothetical protein BWY06_03359 [Candidatus Latescibacteria bacterium ADurb.Bin168]|nr:MAG: hypothetical protein BWY06_03359 [Candidatus Latescibacteria bacterium ADurb.Bin168]